MTDAPSLGYVFAAGSGPLEHQSRWLLRSIRLVDEDAPVYVFLPTEERDDLDPETLSLFEAEAEVLDGEIPVPEFPISAKVGSLAAAETVAETDYLLMLDTDTILLDEVTVHEESDAELYVKPEDVGNQFWGRTRSHVWWGDLYDRYGFELPVSHVEATFDHREMLPYFNAGVVLVETGSFGERWLDLTTDIYGTAPSENHADQVALGLLSTQYDTELLGERHNYPIHIRMRCPEDVVVLHYHDAEELSKIWNRRLRRKISETGATPGLSRLSPAYLRFVAYKLSIWFRRKTMPIDETHRIERMYLWLRSLL